MSNQQNIHNKSKINQQNINKSKENDLNINQLHINNPYLKILKQLKNLMIGLNQ